ncbi:MAG: TrmH family RNA methyltransferase [Parachlamydiaceae bacterium]
MTQLISSLQHPLVKHFVKLRTDSAYRQEHQRVVLDGMKPIQEVKCHVEKLLYTPSYSSIALQFPGEKWEISEGILKKISGMISPEGIIAQVPIPSFVPLDMFRYVLALDGINDPGNMGTLLRTALALGWDAVYFLPGSCDPFNEKVMRAARGAHFKLSLAKGSAEQLKEWAVLHQVQSIVADIAGISPEMVEDAPRRLLVLGNEAHGASSVIRRFSQPVTIAMPGEMESLNVGVAGGILLYLLKAF